MTLGARIRQRLEALGWKQTELARRTGVAQTTINSLVNGNARSTPHLIKIAQALQTSPAYLTGETDDPSSVLPDTPRFTPDELLVVDCLRQISPKDRAALIQLARSLAGSVASNTHAPSVLRNVESNPTSGDVGYYVALPFDDINEPTVRAVRSRKRPERKLA